MENENTNKATETPQVKLKFCKHCGAKIPFDAIVCVACGRQVEAIKGQIEQPNIVINNTNTNMNNNLNGYYLRPKNKWVAFALCISLGFFGAHKFYENKAGLGVLYIFTAGLFGIGVIIDAITLLFKPDPYYV